jgi:hypothetical protein
MTIIDKTESPAPMYVRHEKPTFRTTLERDRYWAEEMRRWKEGYNGLTGPEYFYFQEVIIRDAEGALIRPYWRDCDHLIFDAIDKCINNEKDLFVMKRREIGLSTVFGGAMPMYFSLMFPGSTSLVTSADSKRIKELFSEKTTAAWQYLDEDIKPARARTNQQGFMLFATEDRKTKTFSGLQSKIVGSETVDNPASFEAYRAKYCFLDELFLHPRSNDVRNSVARCLMKGTKKVGLLCMGGTAGIANTKGMGEAKSLYKDAKHKGILTLFLRGTLGLKEFSINGHSDEKAAEEWILKRREKLDKAQDKTDYYKFVSDYPLDENEVLSINTESVLPKEVMMGVMKQKIYIMNNPPPVFPYDLMRMEDGTIKAESNRKGKFLILEHPDPASKYCSGTDPIPFNDSDLADGSDFCISIKKRDAETYVAYYAERSLDADLIVDNAILLQDYYNQTPTMLERNVGGVVYQKYKDLERLPLLSSKPTSLGIKFEDSRTTKGYYKNDRTSARGNDFLIKYLLKHTDKLFFMRQIEELEKFLVGNTDLVDSMIACEFQDQDMMKKEAKKYVRPEYRLIPTITRGPDGSTRVEQKKVRFN